MDHDIISIDETPPDVLPVAGASESRSAQVEINADDVGAVPKPQTQKNEPQRAVEPQSQGDSCIICMDSIAEEGAHRASCLKYVAFFKLSTDIFICCSACMAVCTGTSELITIS